MCSPQPIFEISNLNMKRFKVLAIIREYLLESRIIIFDWLISSPPVSYYFYDTADFYGLGNSEGLIGKLWENRNDIIILLHNVTEPNQFHNSH